MGMWYDFDLRFCDAEGGSLLRAAAAESQIMLFDLIFLSPVSLVACAFINQKVVYLYKEYVIGSGSVFL